VAGKRSDQTYDFGVAWWNKPDAGEVNERAAGDYLATLVSKAGELSANLCGEVTILHLQRGDGLRPAL
jgi:hypothetical protein